MNTESDIPELQRDLLRNSLEEGETILWTGRPVPYFFNNDVWILFLNGVFWTLLDIGLIIAYIVGDIGESGDIFTSFTNCSYLLLFLPLTIGACYAPIWTYRKMKRTVYAVSNKRAMILGPKDFIPGLTLKDYSIRKGMIRCIQMRHNGSGDLIFDEPEMLERYGFGKRRRHRTGFVRLRRPDEVESLLKKLIEEKQSAASQK